MGGREAGVGTFTATATFTAILGSSPTISGRITDFNEGDSSLGANWNLFLGATASTATTFNSPGGSGTAHGAIDGDAATGAWAYTLHGSDNHVFPDADRDEYPTSSYPVADLAGVAGWFEASAGPDAAPNAAIAGAFGAACTTGTMCAR